MRPHLLFLLLFVVLGLTTSAQSDSFEASAQKLIYHVESAGLVFIEPLQPGMTLYSLSRKYNVSVDSILSANPDLNPDAIPLGYPVHIPIFSRAITLNAPQQEGNFIPIGYRVQPKETLYRISRVYLGIAPEQLVALNPRADQGIAIGQVLNIGWYNPSLNTHSPSATTPGTGEENGLYEVKDFSKAYVAEGKIIREQKGLAVWKPGNMQSHYYVLHPTARVGSYMEVTNPMLRRTLTAKVAGHIPPGLYQSHVGLVVSPSVAKALGVLDQQFFAKWRFVE